MSSRKILTDPRRLARPALVAAVVPTLFGITAFANGYPIPADAGEFATVTVSGVMLGLLGLVGWWWSARGRPTAAAIAIAGVGGAAGWSLFRPGVTAVRIGSETVLSGNPVLARLVGISPWVLLLVGIVGVVEPVLPGLRRFAEDDASASRRRTRRDAFRVGATSGGVFALLAVAPVYLLEGSFGDMTLLGFSLVGGFVGTLVVVYLLARHGLVTPVLAVGIITAAAAVAVVTGGSPVGYPTAWAVWFLPGLLLGGVEAVGRRLISAVR
ncbi:hypothetical protein [Halorussus amylolyticus]|uniref:hypothetical protein n=1 Tax=Halorussus amylolyticus TaxID=1126242 RepID=UPI001048CACF|nr:hypothetical protein [Halorussus amylolyticus]